MNPAAVADDAVCVVGIGASTAVGTTAPASAAAVRAGISGFAEHPFLRDRVGEPVMVACAPFLGHDLTGTQRFVELAVSATCEALEPARSSSRSSEVVPTIVGLPEPRPGLPEDLSSDLAHRLETATALRSRPTRTTMVLRGHAAGLVAIETACEMIRSRATDLCLAGGVDSYMDPRTLQWLESCDQLLTPDNAWGFVPGEAAGFCLLCSRATARRLQLDVLGSLLAVATSREVKRIKTEAVCIGEGLTDAVRGVLRALPGPLTRIDDTICDLNGESYRADEFGFMLARTNDYFIDSSNFSSPADCWGDVGAASGPLFVLLATAATRKGYARGPLTLLSTSSEAGERAAAIFHAEADRRQAGE
jgi:3-oxoacyl-[acyl-carrier-protein] synthase-1